MVTEEQAPSEALAWTAGVSSVAWWLLLAPGLRAGTMPDVHSGGVALDWLVTHCPLAVTVLALMLPLPRIGAWALSAAMALTAGWVATWWWIDGALRTVDGALLVPLWIVAYVAPVCLLSQRTSDGRLSAVDFPRHAGAQR